MLARTVRIAWFASVVVTIGLVGCEPNGEQARQSTRDDGPLTQTLEAHGGIDKWQRQRTFTYTLDGFPLSPQVARPNTATVDLHNRRNRIAGEGFTVGFDGQQAWSSPGPDAVGLPPRFFSLGSFYFIGMPFVFADPGVVVQDKGTGEFRGKTYRVLQVGFNTGVGYSSEDDYHLFIDPDTHRLALIHHTVTELPDVDRVTWVFDQWQQVQGLYVPARMTFYAGWNPDDPGEGAAFTIENVTFSTEPPDPAIYSPPPDAVIDAAPPKPSTQ